MSSYSHKDFTGLSFVDHDLFDLSYLTIKGSCFFQREPDTQVFPENMSGVTFINCNLDNCIIPEGNEVIDCSTLRIMTLEDGLDWIVDENNSPIQPLSQTEEPE